MSSKRIVTAVSNDKRLMAMFSGALFSCIALISLLVTTCIWYI